MFWIEWANNVSAFSGNFAMAWQPWAYRIGGLPVFLFRNRQNTLLRM